VLASWAGINLKTSGINSESPEYLRQILIAVDQEDRWIRMALWHPDLHRAFPNSRRRRADVHKRLPGLRDLCDRIAHHEPIFGRDLGAEHQTIIEVIG
jgi:hypothetical protein